MTDDYPQWFKTEVVVWYNNSIMVKNHMESAAAKEMERKSKRGKASGK